jgi:hypothetical protein
LKWDIELGRSILAIRATTQGNVCPSGEVAMLNALSAISLKSPSTSQPEALKSPRDSRFQQFSLGDDRLPAPVRIGSMSKILPRSQS